MSYTAERRAKQALRSGQLAHDFAEPRHFDEPEPRPSVEVDVPLSCRRVTGLEFHAGCLDGKFRMTEQQMKDGVRTLLDCLPEDTRAAMVAELSEVS